MIAFEGSCIAIRYEHYLYRGCQQLSQRKSLLTNSCEFGTKDANPTFYFLLFTEQRAQCPRHLLRQKHTLSHEKTCIEMKELNKMVSIRTTSQPFSLGQPFHLQQMLMTIAENDRRVSDIVRTKEENQGTNSTTYFQNGLLLKLAFLPMTECHHWVSVSQTTYAAFRMERMQELVTMHLGHVIGLASNLLSFFATGQIRRAEEFCHMMHLGQKCY